MAAPPSRCAPRSERKRGISVSRLPGPSLLVYGDSFPHERGSALAMLYHSDEQRFPGLGSEERPGYGLRRDDPLRKFVSVNSDRPRTAGHGPRPKKRWLSQPRSGDRSWGRLTGVSGPLEALQGRGGSKAQQPMKTGIPGRNPLLL